MNTKLINYCHEDYPEIQQELQRVVTMAYEGGIANAKWVIDYYKTEILDAGPSTPDTFEILLEKLLAENMLFRTSIKHPFGLLPDNTNLNSLTQKFALVYLSSSTPDEVLKWLQGLDRLEERVQFLADGVCQLKVKLELLNILNQGFHNWLLKNSDNYTNKDSTATPIHLNLEALEESKGDSNSKFLNEDQLLSTEPQGSGNTREELVKRLHGFPWSVEPSGTALYYLYSYFLKEKFLDESFPLSEFTALFTDNGPTEPIRFLGTPGKLVVFFRLVALKIIKESPSQPELLSLSKKDVFRFSFWLNPRLIGTFRDKDGNYFNSDQLTKSAGRWPENKLRKLDWFITMEKELAWAVDLSKKKNK
jgi:hypothetical protein